jgi:hypothetical protein
MSRSLVRFLLYVLIAALPLQGYAAGGCCAKADQAMTPHCGMAGMRDMAEMPGMAGFHDGAAQAHGPQAGHPAAPSPDAACAMHAAHHHQGDADGAADHCASCASCCAAVFALPPALPALAGAVPLRVAHAPPLAPSGNHIPAGPERPPRLILS